MRAPPRPAPLLAALATAALLLAGCKSSPPCPAGQTSCGGLCFDLLTDPRSCGTCLRSCPTGAACQAGQCTCPAGQLACGGACVDPLASGAHCGGCDQPCGTGTCNGAGACDCGGTTACPGAGPGEPRCADTAGDPANCGTCGRACRAGETCTASACLCSPPRQDCPAGCFDFLTDERRCGTSCATAVACPATATCVNGACQCPAGRTRCGSACVDTTTDEANCNGCGNACAAGATCTASACACPAGLEVCGAAPGSCVDKRTDEANCGGCGSTDPRFICAADRTCLSGACCLTGQQVCGAPAAPACCDGTGCCAGGACQVTHSNGLGQSYFSCDGLGTYTQAAARLAADAWGSSAQSDQPAYTLCAGTCFLRTRSNASAMWCYQGLYAGLVSLNTISIAPICPTQLSPGWD